MVAIPVRFGDRFFEAPLRTSGKKAPESIQCATLGGGLLNTFCACECLSCRVVSACQAGVSLGPIQTISKKHSRMSLTKH